MKTEWDNVLGVLSKEQAEAILKRRGVQWDERIPANLIVYKYVLKSKPVAYWWGRIHELHLVT